MKIHMFLNMAVLCVTVVGFTREVIKGLIYTYVINCRIFNIVYLTYGLYVAYRHRREVRNRDTALALPFKSLLQTKLFEAPEIF